MRNTIDPERVRLLAGEGKTKPEIAKIMNIPYNSVVTCCTNHKIVTKSAPIGRQAGTKPEKAAEPKPAPKPVIHVAKQALTDDHAAHEAKALSEIITAAGVAPHVCESRKPTPVEALSLKIKLPWAGKVQQQTPDNLAPDLYDELIGYGNFDPADIAAVFGFTPEGFRVWLKKYGYPVRASEPVPAVEHDLTIKPRPGQTFAGRKKEMDATPVFRAHDVVRSELPELIEQIHTPTPDEIEEVFAAPGDALTLRECAARLMAAIDDREDAGKRIEFYRGEIRRMA